jgi:hypothetical protein
MIGREGQAMNSAAEHWLILQFPEDVIDFDRLIEVETLLIKKLDCISVDGHDMGSGEANVFVVTTDPRKTFEQARKLIPPKLRKHLKAAYRVGRGGYVILWPPGLRIFKVV